MTRLRLSELPAHVGRDVVVAAWVYNLRSSGRIYFLQLRDGSARVQAVCAADDVTEEAFARCRALTPESAVEVRGTVREDPRSPSGVELAVRELDVISLAEEYPLQKKDHGVDFLLDHRHLWLRSPRPEAILKIRATVEKAVVAYLDDRGFIRVDAPILTGTAAEGSTTLFELDYFGTPAYLSQSGQLYNEANAAALGRVYCCGPTFRAEKSKTRRHVMEFWMVEPEAAFLSHDENVALAEGMVVAAVAAALREQRPELELLGRDVAALEAVRAPFPRLSYDDVIERLRAGGYDVPWGENYGAEEETSLTAASLEPLVVEYFPRQTKAFYMKRHAADPRLVDAMDILAPEGYGEIVGGSCRENDLGALRGAMADQGVPEEPLRWYLDLRRYGGVPTAGFGLGVCRTVAWIAGLKHIREAIPYPRMLNRLYP
jgi:asparaginyl-tRNA synthetase